MALNKKRIFQANKKILIRIGLLYLGLLIGATNVFAQAPPPPPAPVCTPYTYDCSYCAETTCTCSQTPVAVSVQQVKTLPFNWSHADTNTGNDSCSGTSSTCNCNYVTPAYSATTLPANQGACTWSNPKVLPADVTCSWQDGTCSAPCTKMVSNTCSGCR